MPVASSQPIPVTWTATMPGDTNTYYPVAILKDTRKGTIIEQINLAQDILFSQRYSGVFSGVPDPSGLGKFFDITVLVYIDAGQTQLSQNYQIVNESFRTFDISLTGSPNGPSANSGIGTNYKRIEELFIKALTAKMLEVLSEVKGLVRSIPEAKFDYDRVSDASSISSESAKNELMEFVSDHFAGVGKMLDAHKAELLAAHSGSHESMMQTLDALARSIGTMGDDGKMSSGSMQSAIMEHIEKARDDLKTHHTKEHGNLEKKFDDSSTGVHDSLKGMLTDKEIHLQLAVQPPAKEKKNPDDNTELKPTHSPDEMKTLLGIS